MCVCVRVSVLWTCVSVCCGPVCVCVYESECVVDLCDCVCESECVVDLCDCVCMRVSVVIANVHGQHCRLSAVRKPPPWEGGVPISHQEQLNKKAFAFKGSCNSWTNQSNFPSVPQSRVPGQGFSLARGPLWGIPLRLHTTHKVLFCKEPFWLKRSDFKCANRTYYFAK